MIDLYCVGCDSLLVEGYDNRVMNLSCSFCRASSPILVDSLGNLTYPSICSKIDEYKSNNPHLEVLLGYSTYESHTKDLMLDYLILKGCISQKYCTDISCTLKYKYSMQAIKVYGSL